MFPFYEEKNFDLQIINGTSLNFPPHLHNAIEILFIREGKLFVQYSNDSHTMTDGDFLMVFPNTIHSYKTPGNKTDFSIIICHPRLFGDYLNELTHSIPASPVIHSATLHADIPYAMQRLMEEYHSSSPSQSVCRALIQLILARSLPSLSLQERHSPSGLDLPSRMITYISQNFCLPLSLDDVARQVGASKCHLSHVFSSKLHTTFHRYINSFRINLAQNLLCNTDYDILTISQKCGFESQRSFNRVFHQYCDISPSQYRTKFTKR